MTSNLSGKRGYRLGVWLTGSALAVLLIGFAVTSRLSINAATAANTGGPAVYAPTEKQQRITKLVSAALERSHYRRTQINDAVSSVILDRYLDSLDPARSYFTAADIGDFERIRYQLDDAVLNGAIDPAFAVV